MNIFKIIKLYLKKRETEWISKLSMLGFDTVKFPIILKEGNDIEVVYCLRDFATDPDLYYHEYDDRIEFIDSDGQVWSFKYNFTHKTNLPDKIKYKLTIEQIRDIICIYFKNTEIGEEIIPKLDSATSIENLIEIIVDKL